MPPRPRPRRLQRTSHCPLQPKYPCPARPTRRIKPPCGPTSTACGISPTRPPVLRSQSTRRSRRREEPVPHAALDDHVHCGRRLADFPSVGQSATTEMLAGLRSPLAERWASTSCFARPRGSGGRRGLHPQSGAEPGEPGDAQNVSLMLFGSTGPVYLGMIAGRQKVSRFSARRAFPLEPPDDLREHRVDR